MNIRTLVVAIAVVMLFGNSSYAQSCEQGGYYPICGPICSAYYDVVYDGNFDQTSCDRWGFDSSTGRASDGFPCGWDSYYGKISGPTNGWKSIYQFTETLNESGRDDFYFGFDLEMNDSNGAVEVWVGIHPSIWTLVYSATGTKACGSYTAYAGNHPEWVNNTLMIVISGNVGSGKHVKVDRLTLDQY